MVSVLDALSYSLTHSLWGNSAIMLRADNWTCIARNWRQTARNWPTASKEQKPSIQHPKMNWVLPTWTWQYILTWSSLRWDCSPIWQLNCNLLRDLEPRHLASDSWKCDIINAWNFKLLSFGDSLLSSDR